MDHLILLFPERFDFPSYRKNKRYTPLIRYFDTKGYDYIDLFNAFDGLDEKFTLDELFMKGNHYSPLGNELVAGYIWSYLQEHKLTDENVIKHKLHELKSQKL